MNIINLKINPKIFKRIINDKNLIGGRSEGKIYKLTRLLLVKIYNSAIFPILNDRKDLINSDLNNRNKIEKLIQKRKYIRKSSLPIGIITYNDYLVGVIIIRKLFTMRLDNWLQGKDEKQKQQLFKILEEKQNELLKNNIYYVDFNETNILVKPNNEPELVDFDGQINEIFEKPNPKYLNLVKNSFNRLKNNIFKNDN